MKNKKINIGDTFLSWKVKEPDSNKRYYYICECVECGAIRSFCKYNLLKGSYAPCRKCGHKSIGNISKIRRYWNPELNESVFTKIQDYNLTSSFWFLCPNGHNFKSTLKDFNLKNCLSCASNLKSDTAKTQILEYSYSFFKHFCQSVKIDNDCLTVEELRLIIYFVEQDKFTSYRNYFKNESDMFKYINHINLYKANITNSGYTFLEVTITENLNNNIAELNSHLSNTIFRKSH